MGNQHTWKPNVRLCACGDHAFAPITKGYSVMVSPEDAHLLQRPWKAHVNPRYRYVTVLSSNGGALILARAVMNPPPSMVVDHKSAITVDNRRSNLRICTQAENMANTRATRRRGLPVGVYEEAGGFKARIYHNKRCFRLGTFATPEEAGRAYQNAWAALHSEFVRAA